MTLLNILHNSRRIYAFTAALCMFLLAFGGTQVAAQEASKHLALIGIQSGTVAPSGIGFAGFALTNKRAPKVSDGDGSAFVGFGFGDATRTVGVQATAHITSVKDSFGDSGYLSLKFSRRLLDGPSPVYASLRFGQLANWGDADGRDETAAVAISRFSHLTLGNGERLPVMMTLGAGTHLRNFETDPGVFAGFGVGLTQTTAASLAWTGDSLSVGTSFRFKGAEDIIFGLSVDDATDRNDNRRVILSVGYRFNLFGG
ncbi:MAG: hypothetical protein WBB25_11405 [Sulfitobacter sp.]